MIPSLFNTQNVQYSVPTLVPASDKSVPQSSPTSLNGNSSVDGEKNNANNPIVRGNAFDRNECKTCASRKYKDGSDDPGVSFKTATKLSPEQAASAVRAHEGEHVVREQAKADRTDREVVSQSVTYQTAICPECGRAYVSGGTTRTVTKGASDDNSLSDLRNSDGGEKGKYLDITA